MVSVLFKPEHGETLAEAADSFGSVLDSFVDFPDPVSDVYIVDDGVVEEDSLWDLRDWKSKDDRGPFALQRIHKLF